MCQLLETIRADRKGLRNLSFHNERVNHSRARLFQASDHWDLADLIRLPDLDPELTYRCRFIYAFGVNHVEFLPYLPRRIHRLFLVRADHLEYSLKYLDRSTLERLKKRMAPEPDTDILIVRNGLITDTSVANLALYDGNRWFTPASPLLKGTKRAYYLKQGLLKEKDLTPADLSHFSKVRLINALVDLEEAEDILIGNIIPGRDQGFQ